LLVIILFSIFSQDFWLILGDLSWSNILLASLILSFPPFLFIITKLKDESHTLVGKFPTIEEIKLIFKNIDYFKTKFNDGLIT